MSDQPSLDPTPDPVLDVEPTTGVSRRNLMLGLGGLAGVTAAIGALPGAASASLPAAGPLPEALDPISPFLTYVGIDGTALMSYAPNPPESGRYYDNITGFGRNTAGYLAAPLMLPAGSVIYQINVSYVGQPIPQIFRRQFTAPNPWQMPVSINNVPNNGTAGTFTANLATPLTLEADSSYSLQFFLSSGSTIYGATVGYLPPTQSFVPFVGTPRILDTREPGGGGKLAPTEERTIALGFPGARGAVINLTVTDTEGAGFVAVNPANIAYPGNSSINWTTTGQNTANGVITAMDAGGQIKIRGGVNNTHVVIDRIGWLI